MKDRKKNK